jgi:hypothetical protein
VELSTIEMKPEDAKKAFEQYRDSVRQRHSAEDEQIMRGYKALSKGTPLIRLSEAVRAGGTTTITYRRGTMRRTVEVPKIAVARAHAEWCWTFGVRDSGSLSIQTKREPAPNNTFDIVSLPSLFDRDDERTPSLGWRPDIRAQVPIVPPPLRPKHSLSGYHVLFEAEWGIDPVPPTDPALLKRVGGDLYAVVAVWDLTEVERAVLAGRD